MRSRLLVAVALGLIALLLARPALFAPPASAATPGVTAGVTAGSSIPPYVPRFGRRQPVVAVIAENTFTELTDYVLPYGVLAESGVAEVLALSTQPGPVQLFPALRVEAQATIAQFDARFPDGADYVIVPAVHRSDDPTLLAWVKAQAARGATLIGVCDGVWVLAQAGLLDGHRAVGHWYAFDALQERFAHTRWLRDTRYVADGKRVTTTGVTASVPVSLALVEAIGGRERAAALAARLGVASWDARHPSASFALNPGHVLTAAGNWLAFWRHEEIAIPIADGIDEIALALAAEAWSRTWRSNAVAVAPAARPITTRRGLVLLPEPDGRAAAPDLTLTIPAGAPPVALLEHTLQAITQRYGSATAAFVALQLEYPRD